ncbi:hypothetical protein C0J52_06347 [Blattella germanica]|nr:hypothetical protein C0J52_06347 [Blattella germanica]
MEGIIQYPPGDSRMIDKIVYQLKSQGIFDQFRKECLADVDTKPAYQNLHQRVEGSVTGFLASQEWLYVAPLTIENIAKKEDKKLPTLTDLLPKELEPISPESDTLKGKEDNSMEDGEVGFTDEKEEEESSPPFEPIDEINSHADESSMDSQLSGISELTSHGSQHSHALHTSGNANMSTPKPAFDLSNNDSQLSKVSSGSRLSIVSLGEQDYKVSLDTQTNDESQHSKSSFNALWQETQTSARMEINKKEQETFKGEDSHITSASLEDSNSSFKQLHIDIPDNSETDVVDGRQENEIEIHEQDSKLVENEEKKIYIKSEDGSSRNEEKNHEFSLTATREPHVTTENKIDSIGTGKVDIKQEEEEHYFNVLTQERDDVSPKRRSEDDIDGRKSDETLVKNYTDRTERKMDEKSSNKLEELSEKKIEDIAEGLDDKRDKILDDKSERKGFERKSEEKCERKAIERKADEKLERRGEEKSERKVDEKLEKKYEKQLEEKVERKNNDKPEKKPDEKSARKSEDKSGRKTEDRLEKKYNEKKYDEKMDKKLDEKSERKTLEKSEKKFDERADRKLEEKYDRKSESKSEKKDDRHEKKHDKHREDREKSKDKKRLSSENRDSKKGENSSHSSGSDRRKSDKDKHHKERGDSRGRSEKTDKYESKDSKNKIKCDEKIEKDSSKEKSKSEIKDFKDDKKYEDKDKKSDKECIKERSKKEETESLKHEKDAKRTKTDDKKERDAREKQRSDDRVRTKHEDKHRERTKSEGKERSDKEKSSRYDEKGKDSSRSNSKENKDRSKQDVREKGKEAISKSDEKKSKDKVKHEDKSAKIAEKGSGKKSDSKSSRSTDHKSKDSSKKNKDSKGKSVTDDHRVHRDKHSEDRRSADRDSNGTPQDRSFGGTTSRTNGNESQTSQSRHEKGGTTSTSSKSDSGGNSDSSCTHNQSAESSMNMREPPLSPSKSSSPPSSLPFKKRPLSHHSEDEHSDGEDTDVEYAVQPRNSIKKPKIAANIFEVKKIMMLRKSLAKKEREQQKEQQAMRESTKDMRSGKNLSKPVPARRKNLGDVENLLRKEVDISLSHDKAPKVEDDDEDIPDLKYFEPESSPNGISQSESRFLAYVKRLETENLSEISTPSDSENSDTDDVICLSNIHLDKIVAKELGATLIESDNGTEVLFPVSPERSRSPSVASESGTAVDYNIIGDTVVRLEVESRPDSRMSNSSDKSDLSWRGSSKRRRDHLSSSDSNKSASDKIQQSSFNTNEEKRLDTNKQPRKRVFSRKKMKKDIEPIPEVNPKPSIERRELRRARKPNTRYSSKEFASLSDEENSYDAFASEEKVNFDQRFELKSDPVVVLQDVSKSNMVGNNSIVSVSSNKVKSSQTKIPATVTRDDEDSSDHEHVSESVGDGYDIIRENNNVDKGSSEDERGCGDGSMLNQDLILPTLRDLMVESGFRRQDDKSDFLPSLVGVVNCISNDGVENQEYGSNERSEGRKVKLGRSRRVGLSRPPPKSVSHQANNEVGVKRTATPPDFVMPLSPESDVSASSGEARKALLDKVGDNNADASASNSDDKNAHKTDQEIRRSLRSGGHGTPGGRGQRYNSDDLYKPRPLFSQGSRRVRGRVSPTTNEEVTRNCSDKIASDVSETPMTKAKKRR